MKMKKVVSTLLCMSLLCALLLACSGCGGGKGKLVGDWTATVDVTDALKDELERSIGDDDAMSYFKIDKFTFVLNLTLDKDGDYTLELDGKSMEKSMDGLVDSVKDGLADYLEKTIQDQGLDMSVDEFCQAMGDMSYDEFFDQMIDKDQLMPDMDEMNSKGTYEAEDGVLTLKDKDSGEKSKYDYELKGSKLTLDLDGELDQLGIDSLEFEKD